MTKNNIPKKIIYVDMDGVLCDFEKGVREHSQKKLFKNRPDLLPNIFRDLNLIDGAKVALDKLNQNFEVYILSSPSWDNYDSWTQKRLWVEKNLGPYMRKKLILSHHKNLQIGDYLIDDNPWNGAKEFKGEWIHFGSKKFPNWETIIKYLI